MKRLSWKYIAGLVDGEGCIDARFYKNKKMNNSITITPRIRITLAEGSKFVLEMLKVNHGGWLHFRDSGSSKWQNSYTWQLQGPKIRPFLQNIVNHMYLKKEQARLAIWIQDKLCQRSMRFPEKVKQLASDEMKAMKTDPQRLSETAIRRITSSNEYEKWKENAYTHCRDCGSDKKHEAHGYCSACYQWHRRAGVS